MSRRQSFSIIQRQTSRRAVLSAIALGVSIPVAMRSPSLDAAPPGAVKPTNDSQVAVRTAVERRVRTVSNKTVRLAPVNKDFARTVVSAIATDPRSEIVAVAGDDNAIRILNASTMRVVKTLTAHTDLIRTLDFDPEGKRLVSAGNDGQLILWDRDQDFKIKQRMRGTPALARVAFSPEGNEMAAVGFGSQIYLIGHNTGPRKPTLDCDCNDLRALAYSKDGKLLAVSGRTGELSLFNRITGEAIGQHKVHSGRVYELLFIDKSPVVVSVGGDGEVCLFDTHTKRIVQRIKVTSGKLFSVTILDQEHLAVAGSDNKIRVVNLTLGRVVEELSGHNGSIAALESDGSLLFSGGYDATLRRWEMSGLQAERERIADRDQKLDR